MAAKAATRGMAIGHIGTDRWGAGGWGVRRNEFHRCPPTCVTVLISLNNYRELLPTLIAIVH